jgi:hypothetical protein
VQPGYTITASAIVVPPSATGETAGVGPSVNPLVSLPTSTQAKALSIVAAGPEFRSRITGGESLASYSVSPQARDPFLTISVESQDQDLALSVGTRVIEELQAELDTQQPGVPAAQRVTLQPLVPPSVVAVDDSRLRALVVALAVGVLVTLAVTVLIDGLLDVRARHRARGASGTTHSSTEPPADPTRSTFASSSGTGSGASSRSSLADTESSFPRDEPARLSAPTRP